MAPRTSQIATDFGLCSDEVLQGKLKELENFMLELKKKMKAARAFSGGNARAARAAEHVLARCEEMACILSAEMQRRRAESRKLNGFKQGDHVQYFSKTYCRWLDTTIVNVFDGYCDLAIKPGALISLIRPLTPSASMAIPPVPAMLSPTEVVTDEVVTEEAVTEVVMEEAVTEVVMEVMTTDVISDARLAPADADVYADANADAGTGSQADETRTPVLAPTEQGALVPETTATALTVSDLRLLLTAASESCDDSDDHWQMQYSPARSPSLTASHLRSPSMASESCADSDERWQMPYSPAHSANQGEEVVHVCIMPSSSPSEGYIC